MVSRTQPLIVIVGETASGKSTLAVELAKRFDGEIINADSWQVYRGMDIGTAKPAEREQAGIRHHLIDIIDPDEDYTAAVYKKTAQQTIREVAKRDKLPIMVGGTGLYIDGVLYDYSFAPGGEPVRRSQLSKKTIPQLLDEIKNKKIDLTGVDTRNKRRLIRLLETNGLRPTKSNLRSNTLVLGVKLSRASLRSNIESRVEVMFRRGLKHEVSRLAGKYGWGVESMKGIGYREFQPYFSNQQSLAETKRKIIKSTLSLAKKQRTWFKKNRDIKWVNNLSEAEELASRFLA